MVRQRLLLAVLALVLVTAVVGCAAGNAMYVEEPAGFWAGLWHGMILVVAFVISLFNDSVAIYEVHNAGNLYNLGFVLGVLMVSGSSLSAGSKGRKKKKKPESVDWGRVEEKVKGAIRRWVDETEDADPEWKEIAGKIEEKIKRELRKWAEDEEK